MDDKIALPASGDLLARVRQWADKRGLAAPEALRQLVERGLDVQDVPPSIPNDIVEIVVRDDDDKIVSRVLIEQPPLPPPDPDKVWTDARRLHLINAIEAIKADKNCSAMQAIRFLRQRWPDTWGTYPDDTLEQRFYDAVKWLKKISATG